MIVIMPQTASYIVSIKGIEYLKELYPVSQQRQTKSGITYFVVIEDDNSQPGLK